VSTIKHEKASGISFVTLEQLGDEGGPLLAAADPIGCPKDSIVLVASGSAARLALNRNDVPIDLCIMAILDNEKDLR